MRFFIPLFALSLGHVQVQAESAGYKDVLVAFKNVRQSLKQTAGANSCEIPQPSECSFQDYCGTLSKNASNFILYKNAQGREIPNYPLINNVRLMEVCLRQEFPETPTQDPFVYPERFAKGDAALKKLFQERVAQAQETFLDVKGKLLQFIESTRNAQNKNEIDGVIQRIKTVKMSVPDVKDYLSLVVAGCEGPNAFYHPSYHAIKVCPQMLNLPEATLFSTFAHELGHAFDPCSSAKSLIKDQQGQLTLQKGTENSQVLAGATTADTNPFKSVVACLQTDTSIGVKVPSEKQLLANEDNEIKQMTEDFGKLDPAFKQLYVDKKKEISKQYN
ncbi:MAG: hypothetical protein J7501_05060, partial [Bdellovibrio sp.]|nr:hypothetical protein [Bdellovibrio sp.]